MIDLFEEKLCYRQGFSLFLVQNYHFLPIEERFEGYEIKEVDLLNNLVSSESYFELSTSPLSIKASYLRGKNERN